MASIAKGLAARFKETNEGIGASALPYTDAEIGPEPIKLLYAMLFAVFFVLLIACANVANLLLERAAHRAKEISVRAALGATRAAVVRQFLTEALVLAAVGALLGTGVAYGGIRAFNFVSRGCAAAVVDRHRAPPAGARLRDRARGARDAALGRDPGAAVVAHGHQRGAQGRDARDVEPAASAS